MFNKRRFFGDAAKPTAINIGKKAETQAQAYLVQQGLLLVEANYTCRQGEIDLIMQDNRYNRQELVFAEVRYRKSDTFGGALESVDSAKQAKIQATAEHFIQSHSQLKYEACRFDVLSMTGNINRPTIDWIEAAF